MPKLLSGRVGVTSYAGISTSRYEWLGLSEAEPNLNIPAQNDYALFSDVDGNRYWQSIAPSGSVEGITVQDEYVTPVGFGGSITIVNFVGTGVTAIQTKQNIGGEIVGVATVIVDQPPQMVGIGSALPGAENIIEYLNSEIGLGHTVTISSAQMPNAEKAWSIYETLVMNEGGDLIIGDGRTFTVDILDFGQL